MQITINYVYRPLQPFQYWAITKFNHEPLEICGDSFEDARRRLLEKAQLLQHTSAIVYIPPPEEVEI